MIKKLVICAPNIIDGGPLTVLNESIETALINFPNTKIFVIANNKKLIDNQFKKNIEIIEFPHSKKSWISRIRHEFFIFNKLSISLGVDVWFSLQDITSIVKAKYQLVYCHCPIPFYQLNLKDIYLEPSSLVRNLFYNIIYRLNIHRNDSIVVQQEWLRKKFKEMTGHENIIVAKPIVNRQVYLSDKVKTKKKYIFIYPTLARFHKNIELLCEAVKLIDRNRYSEFEVKITINGRENRYAKYIRKNYSNIKEINFIGFQSRIKMKELYKQANALIFPSKLETWGLPISEAINYKLPIMLSNLDYSRETLGKYKNVSFFDHKKPKELSKQIVSFLENKWKKKKYNEVKIKNPYAENWENLWKKVKSDFNKKNELLKKNKTKI